MFKPREGLKRVVLGAAVAILVSTVSAAQVDGPRPDSNSAQDVFASVHQALNDAADRTLAVALSQRSWMQPPAESTAAAGRSSLTITDPVDRVRVAVRRVDQLRPTIEPILREEGVPAEFSAVVLVESGGLPKALSPKGARGVWQFMPDTARRYGLLVSGATDERLDIIKSTRAAARYLHDLHGQFGDWQLALAAYNAGEQAVDRALARVTGARSFPTIATLLPKETRTYVPAVLQAISVFGSSQPKWQRSTESAVAGRVLYASVNDVDGKN